MRTARAVIRTCCFVATIAFHASGQVTSFLDDFEASILNSYWTPYVSSGSITFPSTAQVYRGKQALQLNTVNTAQNKEVGVRHQFKQPTYGYTSVRMFDTGAGVTTSNYLALHGFPFGVFTMDYDLGPGQGDTYFFITASNQNGINSGVRRTRGWHLFEIESWPTHSRIRIDKTTVYSGPGGAPFSVVQLNMNAPSWRPAWTSHFDDFAFIVAPVASSYSLFGSGCAGSNGVPMLGSPPTGPIIGTTLEVTISSLPTRSAVVGFIGISDLQLGSLKLPLDLGPIGMPGCRLLISNELTSFVGNRPTPSTALWSLPIPFNATLLGAVFFQQAFVLDPGANAFGAVMSNAGRAVIGSC